MPEEETGIRRKIAGLPIWVWLIIAAVAVYLIYKHFSGGSSLLGGSATPSTGGGGGAATQNIRLQKGAVTIDIDSGDHEQPKPPVRKRHGEHHKHEPPDGHHKGPGPEPPRNRWDRT